MQPPKNQPDDYIRIIWALSFPTGERMGFGRGPRPTAPARIAERLDVSRATCGEMLNRLTERGLISRGERKEAVLTAAGRIEAMRVVRRFRIVERFATDVLGFTARQASTEAKRLAEGFSDESVERLFRALGEPVRNPHGVPIDPDFELRESPTLTNLMDIRPGSTVTLVRTEASDDATADELSSAGLAPGGLVTLEPSSAEDGDCRVRVGERGSVTISATALRACFVRDEGVPEIPARAECWASSVLDRADVGSEA